MIEIELTKEERELLNLELINSQTTRNKEIKKGILTLVVSILATISLWAFTDKIRFINNFIAIFLCFGLFGAYKSIWWYRAKSVDKLASDIKNGIKLQDRSEIKSYSKQSHKVRLLNGFVIYDFDLQQKTWQIGDSIIYEYTPLDNYILTTKIQNRNDQ